MDEISYFSNDNYNSHILLDLFRNGESKAYAKGSHFDPFQKKLNSVVHLISYGYVKVMGIDKEGRESVHIIYGKGDVFPLLGLVNPVNPQGITYLALTDVRLHTLSTETLFTSIKSNLETSNALVERLLNQFTHVLDRVENKCCKTAEERVVYCLLSLGARFGLKKENTIRLENIFTHELIGKMLGLTRETVSREYKKLHKNGFVDTSSHEITLKDVNALTDVVDSPLSLCIMVHKEKPEYTTILPS